jgi:DNA-binding NarL/FixJ family response regulator
MTEPIRVLVVDDHPVFREGFAALLASIEEVEVVGTAGNGVEALAVVAQEHPDVVVMDVQMPEMDGIEATRRRPRLSAQGRGADRDRPCHHHGR